MSREDHRKHDLEIQAERAVQKVIGSQEKPRSFGKDAILLGVPLAVEYLGAVTYKEFLIWIAAPVICLGIWGFLRDFLGSRIRLRSILFAVSVVAIVWGTVRLNHFSADLLDNEVRDKVFLKMELNTQGEPSYSKAIITNGSSRDIASYDLGYLVNAVTTTTHWGVEGWNVSLKNSTVPLLSGSETTSEGILSPFFNKGFSVNCADLTFYLNYVKSRPDSPQQKKFRYVLTKEDDKFYWYGKQIEDTNVYCGGSNTP